MTKTELIKKVSEDAEVTKIAAERVIAATFVAITTALIKGEKVAWPKFGTFKPISLAKRDRFIPSSCEIITVPAHKAAKFTQSKALNRAMKEI